ncbi:hypothetical protein RRF57_010370 [Xylaria bambusicola]|uniref:C2H2-type domain-containing protein n=1 Tax=Xylaria bambusicola TaxID=326684 RepID=A0AAN7Z9H1_9PEZI
MAYAHPPYVDSTSYSLYAEASMDPEIKRSVSPTSTVESWTVNRYLADSKSPIFLYPTMDSTTSGIVPPFPTAHFQRADSPSYTNSSSTCSSGLSPPRETDYYQMRSPPTPSEMPLLPQYDDSWHPHPQVYQFTGLADACVSLGDVNPMSMNLYEDHAQQRFVFPIRTSSMSSDNSHVGYKGWPEDETSPHTSCSSPDTPILKEEVCIPDATQDRNFEEVKADEPGDDSESLCLKTEPNENEESNDDYCDDDEYNPRQKLRNGLGKSERNGKSCKRRSTSHSSSDAKRSKTTMEESLGARHGPKSSIQGSKGQYNCPECLKVSFKDRSGLENHIKKQHTRPFTCIFEFAGCCSTFASKNEWKRHCASQHIVLQYWVCQQEGCAQVSNKPSAPKKSSSSTRRHNDGPRYPAAYTSALPNGTIFNRKDLYTQHLRRMHVPAHLKSKVRSKTHVPEWEEQQRMHQNGAVRTRCQLPTHMRCPAVGCNVRFDGTNAWDERMEHVAKHLEKAAAGTEPPVKFGGDTDGTLVDWATSPAIGILRRGEKGRWAVAEPAQGHRLPCLSTSVAGLAHTRLWRRRR